MTVLLQRLTAPAEWLASRFLGACASPRRILGTTLPLRLALLAAALGIATLGLTAARSTSTSRGSWVSQFDTRWILASVAVLTVLPGLVFLFSKIWLDGRSVRSPDIDRAWAAGLRALELKGIDLTDVPLFLVTGVGSDADLRALMKACDRGFDVNHVPDEPAPLQWYGSRQAVFLCLTDLSLVGHASRNLHVRAAPAPAPSPAGHPRSGALSRTISVPGGSPYDSIPFVGSDSPPSATASYSARGTMQFGDSGPPGATGMHSTIPDPAHDWDADDVQRRMAHVCRLLKTARRPFVPANGIVSVLPFRVFGAVGSVVEEFQKCVADDLAALRDGLEVRCPVTALVGGMETESGFRELVRRLGRDAVKSHRFGKGNEVWAPPEPELVEAVVRHACGAFEDWTYHLFTQEEGLAKPGNAKLYALLCRMRTEVQEQLTALLSEGYGNEDDPEAMLFSGVYFAATGQEDDRQAFVKSVFHKVVEQDDDISWTEIARSRDARYGLWKTIAGTVNLVLLALLAMLLFFWATNRPVPATVQGWLSRTTALPVPVAHTHIPPRRSSSTLHFAFCISHFSLSDACHADCNLQTDDRNLPNGTSRPLCSRDAPRERRFASLGPTSS